MPSTARLNLGNLLNPSAPQEWKSPISQMRQFMDLVEQYKKTPSDVAVSERLLRLNDEIISTPLNLLEPQLAQDMSDSQVKRIFAKSIFLLSEFKRSVGDVKDLVDTAGSRTLHLYEADYNLDEKQLPEFKKRLALSLNISSEEIDAVQAEVQQLAEDQNRKIKLLQAARKHFGLKGDDSSSAPVIKEMCDALFPSYPLLGRIGEIILTSTHLFVCLPSREEAGLAHDNEEYNALEKRLNQFTPERMGNFPAFGFVNRQELANGLIDSLSALSGLSKADVLDEIPKVVTVLRLEEVDKYIVHDTWGHGWQATLMQFEHMFEELVSYSQPLSIRERTVLADHSILKFQNCFEKKPSGEVVLNAELCREFMTREYLRRLPATFTGVLGEMLADVAEFKFVSMNPNRAELMPNSSLFKSQPAKLDLSLSDLESFFRLICKDFDRWAKQLQNSSTSEFSSELAQVLDVKEDAVMAPVQEAVKVWLDLRETVFKSEILYEETPAGLTTNLYTRLALNFLSLHQAIIKVYKSLEHKKPAEQILPLKSYRDLLIIGAAVFFEEDRIQNIWKMDEFLSLKFVPLCLQFED